MAYVKMSRESTRLAYARSQIQSCSKAQDMSSITEFLGKYTCGPLIAVDPDQDVSHECMLRNFTLNGRVLLGEEDSVGTGSGSPLAAQSTTQSLTTQTALSVADTREASVMPATRQSLKTQTASPVVDAREISVMPATTQSLTTLTASSVVGARESSVIGRSAEPTHSPKHFSTPHSTTQSLTTQTASSVVNAKETSGIPGSQGTEPTRSPKHSSIPHSIAIGAGIAIPVALVALSPLGLYLLTKRRRRRRKQAEHNAAAAKASTKRKTPPRWSKDMLDSSNIYELDGRGTVQELDSRPVGAMEILSNPIHEAGEQQQRPESIMDRPGGHRPSWIKAWRMSLRRSMVKNRFTF
ncbi:MAG: hypothetical protein LQ350_002907 [Teloschistes chrysophthalmus]|nr:MAG: hypothetical protein LQ350_002907 [Niorma chrysophthalma]